MHFGCQRCGYCCHQHGRYQFIYVTPEDVQQMAAHLGLTAKAFRARFTKKVTHGRVLIVEAGHCVFFREGEGCMVHAAKPLQCATWPFWPDNIKEGRFTPAVLKICKGCSPDGC